jgi:enoyl-[acyl-carrier protein] reductase I
MTKFFTQVGPALKGVDFMVNGMAFANKEALTGDYVDTSREDFKFAHEISCYSFTKSVALVKKYMAHGGSCLGLTYYGAEKWMPHYNVMGVAKAALEASIRYLSADLGRHGIRVNGLSAGPVRTLASSGIGDFNYILEWCGRNSPLERNVSLEEIGSAAGFLLSDWASGITGEILHVDAGYNIIGMKNPNAIDITLA